MPELHRKSKGSRRPGGGRRSTMQHSRRRLLATCCGLAGLASLPSPTAAQGSISLSPATASANAGTLSVTLSPSYAGMGIEPSNLMSFTGDAEVNQLSYTLLANLGNYTGVPPHLRIGGNSGDQMLYDPSLQGYTLQTNPNPTGPGYTASDNFFFGPQWFQALDRLPPKTPITYGLNLAYNGSDANQRRLLQANASLSMQNVKVVGFEIGNEPDLFVQNGYRDSGWSAPQYGTEWAEAAESVYNLTLKPRGYGTDFFEPGTTATTATASGTAFRISELVNTDVATQNGIYVAGWNQHDYFYFIGVSDYTLDLYGLTNFASTRGQFGEWASQAQQAKVTGKPYYLREMGSVGPTGQQGISDTFGNTLWTFYFFLYAATVQVSSVQIHMTDNSYGSPWEPGSADGTPAHVRSSYYAFAAISQLIGSKCNTRVGSLSLSQPSGYDNTIAAFSVYRGDTLAAIAIINAQPSYSLSQANNVSFTLSLPDFAGKNLFASYLNAASIDATENTTWNGISYEQSGDGSPTTVRDGSGRTFPIGSDGSVTVNVHDSQAVVLQINSRLGSDNTVDTSACEQLSASQPDANPTTGGGAAVPTFRATSGFAAEDGISMGGIAGIFVGAFLLLLFIGFCVFLCMCLRQRRRAQRQRDDLPYSSGSYEKRTTAGSHNVRRGGAWAISAGQGRRFGARREREVSAAETERRGLFGKKRPVSAASGETFYYDASHSPSPLGTPQMPAGAFSAHGSPASSRIHNARDSPLPARDSHDRQRFSNV